MRNDEKKTVLFGAGEFSIDARNYIEEDISFYIDNDKSKDGTLFDNIPVRFIGNVDISELKQYRIVISVSRKYENKLKKQLEDTGIYDAEKLSDLKRESLRKEILSRNSNLEIYNEVKEYLESLDYMQSIISRLDIASCIGSFFRWGYRDLAVNLSKSFLEGFQKQIDSYISTNDNCKYVKTSSIVSDFILSTAYYNHGEKDKGDVLFNEALYELKKCIKERKPNESFIVECKWFLDALYYKNRGEFNISSPAWKVEGIDRKDGRYVEVFNSIVKLLDLNGNKDIRVLDAGCGNGRYLCNLIEDLPNIGFYGLDISPESLSMLPEGVCYAEGILTCLPFADRMFDMVYVCEALEHAIDIKHAIQELVRVIKKGGLLCIIDKNNEALGEFEIGDWEQWPGKEELVDILRPYCSEVSRKDNINYDGVDADTFSEWVGIVK